MAFDGAKGQTLAQAVTADAHSWQQLAFAVNGDRQNGFCYAQAAHPAFDTACSLRAYYRSETPVLHVAACEPRLSDEKVEYHF